MKLFLIIYAAGKIGGAIGPLPYDMAECEVRRDELRQMQAETLVRGTSDETGLPLTKEQRAGVAAMTVECELHAIKPDLGQ